VDLEDIFAMEADGSGRIPVTLGMKDVRNIEWSPDGERIAFLKADNLFVADVGSGEVVQLTDLRAALRMFAGLAWSPDRAQLAFALAQGATSVSSTEIALYVIDAEGGEPAKLTQNLGNTSPVWSPDGKRIVYTSFRSGVFELYAMDLETLVETVLTEGSWGQWSADGRRLAYTDWRNGIRELFAMEAEGDNRVRLTDFSDAAQGNESLNAFRWASDSRHIAFVSLAGEKLYIYTVDTFTGDRLRLTEEAGIDPGGAPASIDLKWVGR
jgi:TolB protein